MWVEWQRLKDKKIRFNWTTYVMGTRMTKTINWESDRRIPSGWRGFREWKSIDSIHRLIRADRLEVDSSATLQVAIPLLVFLPPSHPLLCLNTYSVLPMTCSLPPMIRFIMVHVWGVIGVQLPGMHPSFPNFTGSLLMRSIGRIRNTTGRRLIGGRH